MTQSSVELYINTVSDVAYLEQKDRLVDSIAATKAALRYGVVAGGGVGLANCRKYLETLLEECDYLDGVQKGIEIIKNSLTAPFDKILENAGWENTLYSEMDRGIDILKGVEGNMFELGIIDPVEVTISALTNAVSVATVFITTNCVIVGDNF